MYLTPTVQLFLCDFNLGVFSVGNKDLYLLNIQLILSFCVYFDKASVMNNAAACLASLAFILGLTLSAGTGYGLRGAANYYGQGAVNLGPGYGGANFAPNYGANFGHGYGGAVANIGHGYGKGGYYGKGHYANNLNVVYYPQATPYNGQAAYGQGGLYGNNDSQTWLCKLDILLKSFIYLFVKKIFI